jgi:hypothetical protein
MLSDFLIYCQIKQSKKPFQQSKCLLRVGATSSLPCIPSPDSFVICLSLQRKPCSQNNIIAFNSYHETLKEMSVIMILCFKILTE